MASDAPPPLDSEIARHYAAGGEAARLAHGRGRLEFVRTQELLRRWLPPPPAAVLDVGGAAGAHAYPLAAAGYQVQLLDAEPAHVEQARAAGRAPGMAALASIALGDARRLEHAAATADAVLLLGPLYHLTERADRLQALGEARRVVRPGGVVIAAAISRFASLLDGLRHHFLDDPAFVRIVERDLRDGQHRNPTGHPAYFTTAFFHRPEDLRSEVAAAGLDVEDLVAVEGPAGLVGGALDGWDDLPWRERLLQAVRAVEREPTLLGASDHLLALGRVPDRSAAWSPREA